MIKVTKDKIKMLLKEKNINLKALSSLSYYGVYHLHNWDGGFEGDNGYSGTKEEFYFDLKMMLDFFYELINRNNIFNVIVAPFHNMGYFESWSDIKEIDIYQNINYVLSENNIKSNSQNGLIVNLADECNFINDIIEGGFRYISCICIYIIELGVLIEPTHNFEFHFYSKDFNMEQKIGGIINEKFNLLKIYDANSIE